MIHPITFCIPEEKIITEMPIKKKTMSIIVPMSSGSHTYRFHTEKEYYEEYRESLFAITKRKSGWDCMRHYEIIANGCLPVFENIENCPPNTMALLPKKILKEIKDFYYSSVYNKQINDLNPEILIKCSQYSNELVTFLKHNLTTKVLANYVLNKSGHTNVKKILFLSGDIGPDYQRCLVLHGFKTIFGADCHDFPKIPHIYKGCETPNNQLSGWGMTFTKLIDDSTHKFDKDKTIIEDIQNKKYDIVIYGSFHRGLPYFDLVSQVYSKNRIIMICGEDIHHCCYHKYVNDGYCCFVREL